MGSFEEDDDGGADDDGHPPMGRGGVLFVRKLLNAR